MKVFITGIAGFIGSNLAEYLIAEGHEVRGVDDLSSGLSSQVPASADLEVHDILSADLAPLMDGADAVVHLAARNRIPECQADPVGTFRVNVGGTVAVCEAAQRAGVRRLLYADSSARYEGTDIFPTPETVSAPRSFYAVSKASGADVVGAFARHAGFAATTLRYFNVYGPRQDYRRAVPPVVPAFILALLEGRPPIVYGDGTKQRDFVHVDDVNKFHMLALTTPATAGTTVNIGAGTSHSVLEVLAEVERAVGLSCSPTFLPDLQGEAQHTLARLDAARAFGWTPSWTFAEGVRDCLTFLRGVTGSAP